MRQVYGIQVLDRYKDNERVIFTRPLPTFPVDAIEATSSINREQLEDTIKHLDIPWYSRDVLLAAIFFLLEIQFPNHFYRICLVDWEYD